MVLLHEIEIPPVCRASMLIFLVELTSPKYFECTGTFLSKSLEWNDGHLKLPDFQGSSHLNEQAVHCL